MLMLLYWFCFMSPRTIIEKLLMADLRHDGFAEYGHIFVGGTSSDYWGWSKPVAEPCPSGLIHDDKLILRTRLSFPEVRRSSLPHRYCLLLCGMLWTGHDLEVIEVLFRYFKVVMNVR